MSIYYGLQSVANANSATVPIDDNEKANDKLYSSMKVEQRLRELELNIIAGIGENGVSKDDIMTEEEADLFIEDLLKGE